jgi:hypothetical protein
LDLRQQSQIGNRKSHILILILLLAGSAFSQPDAEDLKNEFGIFAGYSPVNVQGIGITSDRDLFLLNLQYARVLGSTENTVIKYTAGIVPVAFVTQPAEVFQPSVGPAYVLPRKKVYGGGIDPIGFQWNFRRQRTWQPFLNTQGGFLYFTDQVPVPESSRFNFTFSFGTGVQVFRGTRALTLGYKFHHISNAQTGHYNPGIDSNLFYVGWSFLR